MPSPFSPSSPIPRCVRLGLALATLSTLALAGCGSTTQSQAGQEPRRARSAGSRQIFDAVSRSVVAVTNDDKDDREAEIKELEKLSGEARRTPKKIVEVSSRTKPMPHGTGFMIPGGRHRHRGARHLAAGQDQGEHSRGADRRGHAGGHRRSA